METRCDEIAERIFRLSTFVASAGGPAGLTFNQFLIDADEPLLFHTGQRALFASVVEAVRRVRDPAGLRWVTFSHNEADESGAVNEWLEAAPRATAAHNRLGCSTGIGDHVVRPPRILRNDEVIELGGKRVRWLDTPHLPHGWDAGLLYEETTGTLFTSDLFTQFGSHAAVSEADIVEPAIAVDDRLGFTPVTANTAAMLQRLAELKPRRLALMHGPTFTGDAPGALAALAGHYRTKLRG